MLSLGRRAILIVLGVSSSTSRARERSVSIAVMAWTGIKEAAIVDGETKAEEEEFEGLDIGEHGQEAYPNFQIETR